MSISTVHNQKEFSIIRNSESSCYSVIYKNNLNGSLPPKDRWLHISYYLVEESGFQNNPIKNSKFKELVDRYDFDSKILKAVWDTNQEDSFIKRCILPAEVFGAGADNIHVLIVVSINNKQLHIKLKNKLIVESFLELSSYRFSVDVNALSEIKYSDFYTSGIKQVFKTLVSGAVANERLYLIGYDYGKNEQRYMLDSAFECNLETAFEYAYEGMKIFDVVKYFPNNIFDCFLKVQAFGGRYKPVVIDEKMLNF